MADRMRRRFWVWPSELKSRGILGVNARNGDLLARLNPRSLYPRVDDKALSKKLCLEAHVPVPETYALLERFGDIRQLPHLVRDREEFVLKPARGAAGRGVLVISGRRDDRFQTAAGASLGLPDLRYHLATTLAGLYSLGGRPDRAIVEERIRRHAVFADCSVGGTPDIRIVVYRAVPVMAMLRLPTRRSRGCANLHQGAIGAGIDLATGQTGSAVQLNRPVTRHPDTGMRLDGLLLPHWSAMLLIAANIAGATGMGYLGVDIVLDPRRGPLVLEVNARPGLAIQLANRTGLKPLLAAVDRELAPREGVETTTALQGVPREEALSGQPLR